MLWYYVSQGKQEGPVSEDIFSSLVSAGKVKPDTLVWHEGMPDWQPYAQVASETAPAFPGDKKGGETVTAPPPDSRCSVCGRVEYPENLILLDGQHICAHCKPDFAQRLAEQGAHPDAINFGMPVHYGGFWIRVLATLIDGIALSLVTYPLDLLPRIIANSTDNHHAVIAVSILVNLLQFTITALYEILMVGAYGATLGKMAFGLRVVMADGTPISYGRSTGRYFAGYLSAFLFGIGYLMVAFDKQKRALHDYICDTRVIYRR